MVALPDYLFHAASRASSHAKVMLLAVALLLHGCMVPIPSVPGKPPYQGTVPWLVAGSTTRAQVIERLGNPPIQRDRDRLAIYGASRETAARLLGITIVPMTIPLEEFHYLFLDFDEAGVLARSELVVQPAGGEAQVCDSLGRCVSNVHWKAEGAIPVWAHTGDIRRGELAVVTASLEQESRMRRLQAPGHGCLVYLFGSQRAPRWYEQLAGMTPGSVHLALDAHPRHAAPQWHALFSVWSVEPGPHTVRATREDGTAIAEFGFECPATARLIAICAETQPTVAGVQPRVEFSVVDRMQAAALMEGRRLVLE